MVFGARPSLPDSEEKVGSARRLSQNKTYSEINYQTSPAGTAGGSTTCYFPDY